jgi:sec-independent protein translocase protein TatA
VLIVLAILVLFGGKKIPELAKGLGASFKEFKKAIKIWDSNYNNIDPNESWKMQYIDTELEVKPGKETYILTKIVPALFFQDAVLPVYTDTESTFYPDAGSGGTTVDGHVGYDPEGGSWDNMHDHAGVVVTDTYATIQVIMGAHASSNQWASMYRGIFTFDTSDIGSDTIDSATLEVVLESVGYVDYWSSSVSLTAAAPANINALESGDYDSLGDPGIKQADDVPISAFAHDDSTYTNFTLNGTGLATIDATGITVFGVRHAPDGDDLPPSWSSGAQARVDIMAADVAGEATDPKLVVTHSSDTCTYSSGDWNIAAADNCVVSSNTDLGGNDLILIGTGTLDITAQISNVGNVIVHGSGARLVCRNANGCFG